MPRSTTKTNPPSWVTSACEHGRNAAPHDKQRMMEQQKIIMLLQSGERELNRIRASAMFILKPEKRASLIRVFNKCWDRYDKYVGEVTAWCRDEGIKVSADTETAYLFDQRPNERISGASRRGNSERQHHDAVFGRVVILGDAAFVARPHVVAGTTKAAPLPRTA